MCCVCSCISKSCTASFVAADSIELHQLQQLKCDEGQDIRVMDKVSANLSQQATVPEQPSQPSVNSLAQPMTKVNALQLCQPWHLH